MAVGFGLPVVDDQSLQVTGLLHILGECRRELDDLAEHAKLASKFRIGLIREVLEQALPRAGCGHADVQAVVRAFCVGGQPQGVHTQAILGQTAHLVPREWEDISLELILQGKGRGLIVLLLGHFIWV